MVVFVVTLGAQGTLAGELVLAHMKTETKQVLTEI